MQEYNLNDFYLHIQDLHSNQIIELSELFEYIKKTVTNNNVPNFFSRFNDPITQIASIPNKETKYNRIKLYLTKQKNRLNSILIKRQRIKYATINILTGNLKDMENSYQKNNEFVRSEDAATINLPVEKGIKALYTICNIDDFVMSLDSENLINSDNSINIETLNDYISIYWKNIKNGISENVLSQLRAITEPGRVPKKWSGHSIFPILEKLPEKVKNMIRYYITTGIAKELVEQEDLNTNNAFSALDYFLIIRDFALSENVSKDIANLISHSNDYDEHRYDQLLQELDYIFNKNVVYAIYFVLKHELDSVDMQLFNEIEPEYTCIKKVYSVELKELLNNEDIKSKYDLIINNSELLEAVNTLTPNTFCILLEKFNYQEIEWLFETCKNSNECSVEEMLYYCIFFKKYANEVNFTGERYTRINKLFNTIKTSNDLSKLGVQVANWFNGIELSELTPEELDELDKIDSKYLYNSLNIREKIIYEKCKSKGIKFRLYYSRLGKEGEITKLLDYTSILSTYTDEELPEFVFSKFKKTINMPLSKEFKNISELRTGATSRFLSNILKSKNSIDILLEHNLSIDDVPTYYFEYPEEILEICLNEYKEDIKNIPELFFKNRFLFYHNTNRLFMTYIMNKEKLRDSYFELTTPQTNELPIDTPSIIGELKYYGFPIEKLKELIKAVSVKKRDNFLETLLKRHLLLRSCCVNTSECSLLYYVCDTKRLIYLISMLRGKYDVSYIPNSILRTPYNPINFVKKILEKNMDLYKICNEIDELTPEILENSETFLDFYKQLYENIAYTPDMVDQNITNVFKNHLLIVDYYKKKGFDVSNIHESIFFKNTISAIRILKFCEEKGLRFFPELFYFTNEFIIYYYNDIFEYVINFNSINQGTSKKFSYEDAQKLLVLIYSQNDELNNEETKKL